MMVLSPSCPLWYHDVFFPLRLTCAALNTHPPPPSVPCERRGVWSVGIPAITRSTQLVATPSQARISRAAATRQFGNCAKHTREAWVAPVYVAQRRNFLFNAVYVAPLFLHLHLCLASYFYTLTPFCFLIFDLFHAVYVAPLSLLLHMCLASYFYTVTFFCPFFCPFFWSKF